MVNFKFVVSDPQTKKSFQKEMEQSQATGVIGKKIGDEFSGDILGLAGYTLVITGGSDSDGFPMHPQLKGPGRKKMLLAGTPGFHSPAKGMRRRKTVHGDTISDDIAQVNCKVSKKGEKTLEELIPMKSKEKKAEEKPKEEKAEAPKEQKKEEPKTEKPKVEKPVEAKLQ